MIFIIITWPDCQPYYIGVFHLPSVDKISHCSIQLAKLCYNLHIMATQDQVPTNEVNPTPTSHEDQTLRTGELREVSPGHFEISVDTDIDRAIETQAAKIMEQIGRLDFEGIPPSIGEASRRSIERAERGARESIADILGSDEDIEAALGGLESSANLPLQKSYSSEAYADTLRPAPAGIESATIKVTDEGYLELPNEILTAELIARGFEPEVIEKIHSILQRELGDKYNEEMTINEVNKFLPAFVDFRKSIAAGMAESIVASHMIPAIRKALPKYKTLISGQGSKTERQMLVNEVIPDSWQTAEMRQQLTKGDQLAVMADLQETLGNVRLKSFLESLPKGITGNASIMQNLFSEESSSRLESALKKSPKDVVSLLIKTAKIAREKPYIIPRMLKAESFDTVKLLLDTYSIGTALGRSESLEAELNKIIDLSEPKTEDLKPQNADSTLRRSFRATYQAAE